jgi:uncharacterized protein
MSGQNPEHLQNTEDLFGAIESGDVEGVRRMVAADSSLVDARRPSGLSAVLTAVYHRRRDILNVLVARGATLTLPEAAAAGEVDRVERLLESGADPRELSADGWTPLHLASHFGHAPVVEQLLARGADVAARSTNPTRNTPLHAALAGRQSLAAGLLIGHGADVNASDAEGWRPIHLAVAAGNLDALKALVAQGADLTAANGAGLTPIALARQKNDKEAIAYLQRF